MDQWCKSRNNSYRTAPAEADGIEEERRGKERKGIRGKKMEKMEKVGESRG